jgi:hypothetical protein
MHVPLHNSETLFSTSTCHWKLSLCINLCAMLRNLWLQSSIHVVDCPTTSHHLIPYAILATPPARSRPDVTTNCCPTPAHQTTARLAWIHTSSAPTSLNVWPLLLSPTTLQGIFCTRPCAIDHFFACAHTPTVYKRLVGEGRTKLAHVPSALAYQR